MLLLCVQQPASHGEIWCSAGQVTSTQWLRLHDADTVSATQYFGSDWCSFGIEGFCFGLNTTHQHGDVLRVGLQLTG